MVMMPMMMHTIIAHIVRRRCLCNVAVKGLQRWVKLQMDGPAADLPQKMDSASLMFNLRCQRQSPCGQLWRPSLHHIQPAKGFQPEMIWKYFDQFLSQISRAQRRAKYWNLIKPATHHTYPPVLLTNQQEREWIIRKIASWSRCFCHLYATDVGRSKVLKVIKQVNVYKTCDSM